MPRQFKGKRQIAGSQAAQLKPGNQPLQHPAQDKAERLQPFDRIFERGLFDEGFAGTAGDQRTAGLTADQADDFHRAGAHPAAQLARIKPRQVAQAADTQTFKLKFNFRFESQQFERNPMEKFPLPARVDNPGSTAAGS